MADFGVVGNSNFVLVDEQVQEEQNVAVHGQSAMEDQISSNMLAKVSLPFIENHGQVDQEVKFYASTFAGTVFVTDNDVTYALTSGASANDRSVSGVVIRERFLSETQQVLHPAGVDRSKAIVNYFVGKEENWRSNIPTYNSVGLGEVWPSIDVELRAYGKNVEKILKVEPGGSVEDIRLALDGVGGLDVNEKGELLLDTELGTVAMTKPLAFQDIDGIRRSIDVSYTIRDTNYGFAVGHYDPNHTLFIDPLLASTFIGGENDDAATAITLDGSGNLLVAGFAGEGYPTTSGAYDGSYNLGASDAFVSKFGSDLSSSSLIASTFVGGMGDDFPSAISLDAFDNVVITGSTSSSDYPTTLGAYDEVFNGGEFDTFVSKLNSDLTLLLASTFIGGDDNDIGSRVAFDAFGNVFIAGATTSEFYPTTSGAYDQDYNGGGSDAFVSKLNSGLTLLVASSFIGGENEDLAFSIAFSSDKVFIIGTTSSEDFPATSGAYDEIFNGSSDVFVSKFSSDLTLLPASTFVGGELFDFASDIAFSSGDVFITGGTESGDFPATSGAYDEIFNGSSDVFVSKLDSSLSSLPASTFVGGDDADNPIAIAVSSGNIFITGSTFSANYPTTLGAYSETFGGVEDAFVSKFNNDLSDLLASTFVGGTNGDGSGAIKLDGSGSVFIAGRTLSDDYPTTSGAYDQVYNGGDIFGDAFVSHLTNDLGAIDPPSFCGMTIDQFANVIDGTEGDDTLIGTSSNDLIRGNGGNDFIKGRGSPDCLIGGDGIDTILGGGGRDMIEGNDGNDVLKGGGGNDVILGGKDDDTLRGGLGNDTLDGEDGTDSCLGGDGSNIIVNCE
ncbi:MAG: Ca2+-binding RTX toxin-like protein [Candidatus Nitrosomirales archaeon]|jgi:Ca2+-binding RTX toxin-like protein